MIIKGGPRGKGAQLAVHLMRTDTNETVRVFDTRGVFSKTVRGAMQEMEGVAAGSKATRPLYHVSINPQSDERLTDAQWLVAAERLEAALGLEGYQRVMVQHLKQGKAGDYREHMHVVWCRIDVATMKAAHHSHNYRKHEEVARGLEREFNLKRTQGVHAERDGGERPKEKRPSTKESMQEAVTGWKVADAKAMIAAAWNASRNGAAFSAYLEENGYRLAAGDTRDFVVIDPAGGVHSIRSGVKGLRVAEIRSRFVDLDQNKLPSVAEAKESAIAAYAASKAEQEATRQAESLRRAFPEKPARPRAPKPDTYRPLAQSQQTALVNRNIQQRVSMNLPRPTPTPTPHVIRGVTPRTPIAAKPTAPVSAKTEARPATPSDKFLSVPMTARPTVQPPVPSAPVPMPKPVAQSPAAPSAAMIELSAGQDQRWAQSRSQIERRHHDARSKLSAHHEARLSGLVVEIDQRLKELNGLASRAGAMLDRAERDREIAYLVARRQRSLADEKARQEKVTDDLRREQERELAEARAKHDRLSTMQRQVLEEAERRRVEKSAQEKAQPIFRRPPDLDR